MKKKTKLFKHFITLLNCLALSVPLVILGITYLSDVSARYFSSLSVSHSQTNGNFEDDLDYSFDKNTLPSINDYLFKTLDNVGYLDYELNGYRVFEYHTNEVNSIDDLVVGNVYQIDFYDGGNPFADNGYNSQLVYFSCSYVFETQYILNGRNFEFYPYYFDYLQVTFTQTTIEFSIDDSADSTSVEMTFSKGNSFDNTFMVFFIYAGGFVDTSTEYTIKSADLSLIPPTFEKVEGVDNLQEYEELIEGKSYDYIINNSVNTNMLVNFDFGKIFFNSNMINQNGNIAPYLFLNYMINYFINISLFLFIPEFIICFFYMLRTMTYKLVDKEV